MTNKDGDKSVKTAVIHRQKQARAHQENKDPSSNGVPGGSLSKEVQLTGQCDPVKEVKTAGPQGKRGGKLSSCVSTECHRSPGAQRKLSDASNASEDLSKDSGCLSGKMSSSDSSSEISDCSSDGNKHDSDLSWIDGKAYVSPDSEGAGDGKPCAKVARDICAFQVDAAGGGLSLFNSSGAFMNLMMGETTEDLSREVEDLRSENEYLKVSWI